MEKPQIVGMSSQEYPLGRIDSFEILLTKSNQGITHSHIIPLFIDLGFPKEEVLEKLDIILKEVFYIFMYGNSKIKAHIIVEDKALFIKLDTNEKREKIIKIFEKYFKFPK